MGLFGLEKFIINGRCFEKKNILLEISNWKE